MKSKNINPGIFSFMMMFAAIFFLAAGAVMAQSEQPEQKQIEQEANALETSTCSSARTFTYSSGARRFAFCITDHGNIQNLESPATYKQISNREGYVTCQIEGQGQPYKVAFDAGIAEDGFGPSTITQPGGSKTLPLTITRQTTDGTLELAQTFDWNKEEKEILITMAIKNISASTIPEVIVSRYFDGDIDNTSSGDIYDRNANSIWARESDKDSSNGLTLTALTDIYGHYTLVERFINWNPFGTGGYVVQSARQCYGGDLYDGGKSPGDWIGRLQYYLKSIKPGASKTVKLIYRRV